MTWTAEERANIGVWADGLQDRGDRYGEVVTLSLAASAHAGQDEPQRAQILRDRAQALAGVLPVGTLAQELEAYGPRALATWRDGLLVGLRFGGKVTEPAEFMALIERILASECARFLRLFELDISEERSDARPSTHNQVVGMLRDPATLARPRVVVIGAPPWERQRAGSEPEPHPPTSPLLEPEHGLRALFRASNSIPLSLGRMRTKRHRVIAGVARRIAQSPDKIDADDMTLLGRGLWDSSERVYQLTLETLIGLGLRAAELLPALLLSFERVGGEYRRIAAQLSPTIEDQVGIARVLPRYLMTSPWVTTWSGAPVRAWGRPRGHLYTPEVVRTRQEWAPVRAALCRFAEREGLGSEVPDLNDAWPQRLARIPELGRTRVKKIVEQRSKQRFASLAELHTLLGFPRTLVDRLESELVVHRPPV